MFCPKCGKELPDDSQFCLKCGHAITATATIPAQATPKKSGSSVFGITVGGLLLWVLVGSRKSMPIGQFSDSVMELELR